MCLCRCFFRKILSKAARLLHSNIYISLVSKSIVNGLFNLLGDSNGDKLRLWSLLRYGLLVCRRLVLFIFGEKFSFFIKIRVCFCYILPRKKYGLYHLRILMLEKHHFYYTLHYKFYSTGLQYSFKTFQKYAFH